MPREATGGSLPTWIIESATKPGYIKITCPRGSCGRTAWVHKRSWIRASDYKTRACTYCFGTAKFPDR